VADYERVQEIAWEGRSRLSAQDRVLLEAYMGPRGPEAGSYADVLRARERAVSALPDQADAWVLLGNTYYHFGSVLGFPDWQERATQAFERAAALDSTWVAPLAQLMQLATRAGDTTEIRRLWQSLEQLDSTSWTRDAIRFSAAVALGDDEMRAHALDRLAAQIWPAAAWATVFAQTDGGAEYLDTLTAIMQSRPLPTQDERIQAAWFGYAVAMNTGRPREALGLISSRIPQDSHWHLEPALYWNGLMEDPELVLQRADSTARAPLSPTAAGQRRQLRAACRLARWRLARGETSGVAPLLQRLETGLTMGDSVVPHEASPLCTNMVRAMLAVRQGQPDAWALVERVDSILLSYPRLTDYPISFSVSYLVVADLFEELGKPERALAAVRRRLYHVQMRGSFLSAQLRQEGRLAALTGDRDGAIRAYTHYLELRSDPEQEVLPEVQAVRDELARLLGEPE